MYTNNCFRLLCDLFFDFIRVDFPCVWSTVHKYRSCPRISHTPGGRNIGIGRNDHFVPFSDSKCNHRTMQRRGSIIYTRRIGNSTILCKFFIEFIRILSTGKCGILTHFLNGFQILCLMFLIISRQINSFEHSFLSPSFRFCITIVYFLSLSS